MADTETTQTTTVEPQKPLISDNTVSDKTPLETAVLKLASGQGTIEDLLKFTISEAAPLGSEELGEALRQYITLKDDASKAKVLSILEDSNTAILNSEDIDKKTFGGIKVESKKEKPDAKVFAETLAKVYDEAKNLTKDITFSKAIDYLKKLPFHELQSTLKEVEYQFSKEMRDSLSKLVKGKTTIAEFAKLMNKEYFPHKSHIDFEYPKQVLNLYFSGNMSNQDFSLAKRYPDNKDTYDFDTLDNVILKGKFDTFSFSTLFETFSASQTVDDIIRPRDLMASDKEETTFSEGMAFLDKKQIKKVDKITDKEVTFSVYNDVTSYIDDLPFERETMDMDDVEDYIQGDDISVIKSSDSLLDKDIDEDISMDDMELERPISSVLSDEGIEMEDNPYGEIDEDVDVPEIETSDIGLPRPEEDSFIDDESEELPPMPNLSDDESILSDEEVGSDVIDEGGLPSPSDVAIINNEPNTMYRTSISDNTTLYPQGSYPSTTDASISSLTGPIDNLPRPCECEGEGCPNCDETFSAIDDAIDGYDSSDEGETPEEYVDPLDSAIDSYEAESYEDETPLPPNPIDTISSPMDMPMDDSEEPVYDDTEVETDVLPPAPLTYDSPIDDILEPLDDSDFEDDSEVGFDDAFDEEIALDDTPLEDSYDDPLADDSIESDILDDEILDNELKGPYSDEPIDDSVENDILDDEILDDEIIEDNPYSELVDEDYEVEADVIEEPYDENPYGEVSDNPYEETVEEDDINPYAELSDEEEPDYYERSEDDITEEYETDEAKSNYSKGIKSTAFDRFSRSSRNRRKVSTFSRKMNTNFAEMSNSELKQKIRYLKGKGKRELMEAAKSEARKRGIISLSMLDY